MTNPFSANRPGTLRGQSSEDLTTRVIGSQRNQVATENMTPLPRETQVEAVRASMGDQAPIVHAEDPAGPGFLAFTHGTKSLTGQEVDKATHRIASSVPPRMQGTMAPATFALYGNLLERPGQPGFTTTANRIVDRVDQGPAQSQAKFKMPESPAGSQTTSLTHEASGHQLSHNQREFEKATALKLEPGMVALTMFHIIVDKHTAVDLNLVQCPRLEQLFENVSTALGLHHMAASRLTRLSARFPPYRGNRNLIIRRGEDHDWVIFRVELRRVWMLKNEDFQRNGCRVQLRAHNV